MYRDKEKYGQDGSDIQRSKTKFDAPLKWEEPTIIFTCSWSDWFIEEADEWRAEAWRIIKNTPRHIYQILTKRPERILQNLPPDWGDGYKNVWLGVSIENQAQFHRKYGLDEVPAKVKFISFEPLIGGIETSDLNNIDWIIIGGESGNDEGKWKYRPCEIDWMEYLVNDGFAWGCRVFVKQLGTHLAKELDMSDRHGKTFDEFPLGLRHREMPSIKK